MGQTHQFPLRLHVLKATEQELPEPSAVFDLFPGVGRKKVDNVSELAGEIEHFVELHTQRLYKVQCFANSDSLLVSSSWVSTTAETNSVIPGRSAKAATWAFRWLQTLSETFLETFDIAN